MSAGRHSFYAFYIPDHLLHHDYSTTDRSEDSQRNKDEAETKRLWFAEYGTTLPVPGKVTLSNFNSPTV